MSNTSERYYCCSGASIVWSKDGIDDQRLFFLHLVSWTANMEITLCILRSNNIWGMSKRQQLFFVMSLCFYVAFLAEKDDKAENKTQISLTAQCGHAFHVKRCHDILPE